MVTNSESIANTATPTNASSGSASRSFDPAALMRVKNLEWRARVIVEGFLTGLHRSPYHGFSVEFTEYRPYTSGDDLRFLDWRLLARTDRHYVKRFEDETNLRCYVLLDASRSMGYASIDYSKFEYARTLAATLAYYLARQRDATGLVIFDEAIGEMLPPRFRPGHLHRMLLALERSVAGQGTDLVAPLEQIARVTRKRGFVVLISDLLTPVEDLARPMGLLRALGHEVILFRVLDPAEAEFDFREPAIFEDAESQRKLYVDPEGVRREYLQRFQAHEDQVRQLCAEHGIEFRRILTNAPLEGALFEFLSSRQRLQRMVTRRASPAKGAGV